MYLTENALILREVRFRESDRILTALTADLGKVTLAAHGALSKKSRIAAATQQLTYAELTLFAKDGRYSVREAVTREAFAGLRSELERFALGTYLAECLELFASEGQPEPDLLQLGLNSLYAVSEGIGGLKKVKAAFELRLAGLEGYAPATDSCAVCGRADIQEPVFLPDDGMTVCRKCRKDRRSLPLSDAALTAMRHILNAAPKKMLSFSLEDADLDLLVKVSENWLLHCTGREISSLQYYRNLIGGVLSRETERPEEIPRGKE
ncbi:MAG: DNA repair protein RecO [Oscillospiraceae bacterium]|nr:DNA repair protein RecO [Oscillospiraceae bacterium]